MSQPLHAGVVRWAAVSRCGLYRYHLGRSWPDLLGDGRGALFIMLNPSVADGSRDDPTVRRCMGFARRWGYGALAIVNLYARRSSDPDNLWSAGGDLVGPENDRHIREAAEAAVASGGRIVCAWGSHGWEQRRRAAEVRAILAEVTDEVGVLGWTGGRRPQPRHPLYMPRSTWGQTVPLDRLDR